MVAYLTRKEGAHGLLGEVVAILTETLSCPYAIVGGWAPYLRSAPSPIRHPGTRDVDVLCDPSHSPKQVERAVRTLFERGYLPSAKHEFQLIRVLRCANQDFAFGVDFLHPGGDSPKLLHPIFTLPVRASAELSALVPFSSIMIPQGNFILQGWASPWKEDFILPDGSSQTVVFPLMTDAGTLVTKAASWENPKRDRDALDIYVTITQTNDRVGLLAALAALPSDATDAFAFFQQRAGRLTTTDFATKVCAAYPAGDLAPDRVRETMFSFLHEAGFA